VVAPDHVQAQVQPGRDARRGQHVAVVDEQHVGVQLDLGEQLGEAGGLPPVRGGGAAVKQPGGGQHERARADRHHPGPPLQRLAQRVVDGAVAQHLPAVDAGHQHRVRAVEHAEVVVGQHGVAGRAAYGGAAGRAGHHLVQSLPGRRLRGPEHLPRRPQVERGEVIEDDDRDPMHHGRILSHIGQPATHAHMSR
jgi:hypothetical protein